MNIELLQTHMDIYKEWINKHSEEAQKDITERSERIKYYQSWDSEKLRKITQEELYEYMSKLWAMRIWGNKQYAIDKIIDDNGLEKFRKELAEFLWGSNEIPARWNHLKRNIKGLGPAIMSELLCHIYPQECILWNRRVFVGLNYLGVSGLPYYNYQMTGEKYFELCRIAVEIKEKMKVSGIPNADLLMVDYFIWQELQVKENLSAINRADNNVEPQVNLATENIERAEFIHDEIKDKLRKIGELLGFDSKIESKVADGAVVDAIWNVTIGNMGRVIYVFEVQTKGNIDSLILNLVRALNNPAVQGIVAVSDSEQIEKIRREVASVSQLKDKLKYWNYEDVLRVHDSLEIAYDSINSLGLVPNGF